MRPLIQYDLDEPPTAPSAGPLPTPHPDARRPPTKKRKRHNHNARGPPFSLPPKPRQHWDDPGSTAVGMVYDDQEGDATIAGASYTGDVEEEEGDYDYGGDQEEEEDEDESRALTHDEIWDDAALVDAWHAAEAEYEVPCPSFRRRRSHTPRPTTARRKPGKQNP